ncbi:uncharacterized protein KIAA2012 homolog [Mixophyes fleayi]|uniref:uncharacterized protein KIAA2012 homolog n=1 Tax=Mixophyes fleayi TaxID=3061075 RepID=UPI003F4E00B6
MSTLSLLCRGNAQVVRPLQEKLEVCYEPEDYFNWKSRQEFHIRRFLSDKYASYHYWEFPTPKTYFTRKGALVLFSEDLALPSWNVSQDRWIKKRHRYKRKKFKLELGTLQDLTGAILAYGRKQNEHTESHWQPYLHFLNEEDIPCDRQIRPGYSPKRYLTRLFQTWDPNAAYRLQQAGSLRDSVQLQQLATCVGDSSGRHPDLSSSPLKYQRLPVFSSLPHWTNTDVFTSTGRCTPVEEETGNDEELGYDMQILEVYGKTSEVPLPSCGTLRKTSPEQTKSHVMQKIKTQCNLQTGEVQQTPSSRDDLASHRTDRSEKPAVPVDACFWKENISPPHGKPHTTFYGGSFAGRWKYPHSNQDFMKQQNENVEHLPVGGFLPPISQSLGPDPEVMKDPNTKESLKLPSITEEPSKVPQRRRRCKASDPPKELLVIPLLVHFENQKVNREEEKRNLEGNMNNELLHINEESVGDESQGQQGFKEQQVFPLLVKEVPVAENRIKPLQMDISWNGDFNTDGDLLPMPEAPSLGSLPPINGKKGPGNQSSMANLKANNSNSTISSKGLPTGIIRGSIPEELKECCKGSSVGSLIMSPNGEIVCLSLMGAARDSDIPIRFDFIPEEEKEDCLLMESAVQEEQWSGRQQDSEKEEGSSDLPSSHLPINSPERVTSPPYNKRKKGKKISITETTVQGTNDDGSVQFPMHIYAQSGEQTFPQKSSVEKDVRNRQKKDIQSSERRDIRSENKEDVRDAQVVSTELVQENIDNSAVFISEDNNSYFSTSEFPNQNVDEDLASPREVQQMQTEVSGRSTPSKDQMQSYTLQAKNEDKIVQEKRQTKQDATNSRQELLKGKAHNESTSFGTDTLNLQSQESQNSETTAPSTVQDQYSNKQAVTSLKGSGKQPNTKQKISETAKKQPSKPNRKNPEIVKDVEKVPSESKEKQPTIPLQADVAVKASHTEKQELPGEEEMTHLQEITKTVTKETTKRKGKPKTEKAQKTERSEARLSKKANQGAGKEQGKSAFVVGQPKDKKAENIISYPKKPTGRVERQETINATQETPQEVQEEEESDTEKESEDSYVVDGDQERTPTPKESKDLHSNSDTGLTLTTSNQGAEQTADKHMNSTPEETSQAENDHAYSEASEMADSQATSNSNRQRRSSRAQALSEKAEKRRLEVERKRREREEQLLLEKQQQERMEKMKEELEQEQLRRAEEIRLKKQQEEEEKQRQEQEKTRRLQLEQQALERARQLQEEHRKKLQEIQKRKQQEEIERIALERQRQKEQERLQAEERLLLLEMAADEREEYNRQKREKEEQARLEAEERRLKAEEEAKAIMEEAQIRAQLLARQTAALEKQLQFNRGLLKESVGMDQTQGVSRSWVFSYFEFLELLGLPLPVEGE